MITFICLIWPQKQLNNELMIQSLSRLKRERESILLRRSIFVVCVNVHCKHLLRASSMTSWRLGYVTKKGREHKRKDKAWFEFHPQSQSEGDHLQLTICLQLRAKSTSHYMESLWMYIVCFWQCTSFSDQLLFWPNACSCQFCQFNLFNSCNQLGILQTHRVLTRLQTLVKFNEVFFKS